MEKIDFEACLEEMVDNFIITKHYAYKDVSLEQRLKYFSEFILAKRRDRRFMADMSCRMGLKDG